MDDPERLFEVQVEWVPLPHVITTEVIALTYLWRELDDIIRNHSDDELLLSPVLKPFVNEIRDLERKVMVSLGQEHATAPAFRIRWLGGEVSLTPVYHSLMNLGEQYHSPCLILGDTRRSGDGYEEDVNFAFARTDADGWQPFAVNAHGLMAVVVTRHQGPPINTPVTIVTEPLLRLRNG